jgi:hypothetical protein
MALSLSQPQRAALAQWVREALSLSEIQRRIQAEWGQTLTYMEVRFLVEDCQLEFAQPPTPQEPPAAAPDDLADTPQVAGAAGTQVSLDAVTRPGSMMSGEVTFDSGKSCGWQIDRLGRLGLIPKDGYQPTADEIKNFQLALQAKMQQMGY